MEQIEAKQGAMSLLSSAPTAMIKAARRREILHLTLFCLVVTIFLGLRFLTAPPPRDWSDILSAGSASLGGFGAGATIETIAPGAQHPGFSLVGLALALMALALNRPLGFAFLLCDMLGFGQYFDQDQWGLSGWFKFRDLEFLLLLLAGVFLRFYRPQVPREPFTPFRSWLFRVGLVIPGLWLLYSLATMPAQPLLTTLKYTRQFYVWPLLLVVPQFIRNYQDLKQVIGVSLFLILLSSLLYLLQTMMPPFTVLRYTLQLFSGSEEQVRIWAETASTYYLGGCAIFAYLMMVKRTSWTLSALWGLCFLTVISMLGRTLITVFLGSTILIFFLSLKGEKKNIKILQLSVVLLAAIIILGFFLFALGRMEQLGEGWLGRLGEIQEGLDYRAGTLASRWEMFTYLPSVMERNGGSALNALVGMGLLVLTPEQLSPMIHWGEVAPPFWADNGLAGILFATGWLGMILYLTFIILMVRHLWQGLRQAQGPLARSLLLAVLPYFICAPFYMCFSSHFLGVWDEALVLVTGLALTERALTLEPQGTLAADHD